MTFFKLVDDTISSSIQLIDFKFLRAFSIHPSIVPTLGIAKFLLLLF